MRLANDTQWALIATASKLALRSIATDVIHSSDSVGDL
jgi:hypothetical protein